MPQFSTLFSKGYVPDPYASNQQKKDIFTIARLFTTGGGRIPDGYTLPHRPSVGYFPRLASVPVYIYPSPDGPGLKYLYGYVFN